MALGNFGRIPANIMPELSYQISFGNLPNKTVYLDRLAGFYVKTPKGEAKSIDRRDEIKALVTTSPLFAISTSYSGTSGSIPVLLPTVVDPSLYDVTFRDTPLASGLLPRVTNRGIFVDYIRRTALPSAKWKAEMGALASAESTYDRVATSVKFAYAVGEISGPMLVGSRVWQDALRLETEAQYAALRELEENTIINGNPTTDDTDGSTTDEKAFKGLIQTITTNYVDKNGAEISLDNIRTGIRTIREDKGRPDLIVTDYKTLDDIKTKMQDLLRYPAPTANIAFGIENIVFEGIPIVPDLFMPTSSDAREMLILTVRYRNNIQLRVLQDATFEELAKTADSYKFMIKEYLTLIVIYERWCYRIYELD